MRKKKIVNVFEKPKRRTVIIVDTVSSKECIDAALEYTETQRAKKEFTTTKGKAFVVFIAFLFGTLAGFGASGGFEHLFKLAN